MSVASTLLILPTSSCLLYQSVNHKNATSFRSENSSEVSVFGFVQTASSKFNISRVCSCPCLRKRSIADGRWTRNAIDTRIVDNALSRTSTLEIPVTCYQLLGVSDQSEKDEIVKSVMNLKRAEIEEGYTMDTVVSRQDLLMDVRDKLLFEPDYAGNTKENIAPKSPLRIPWAWLPGALCLLQEVGELELVLDIGRAALQLPDAKPYIHDLLLSMALSECAIAKIAFEKNKVSQGFEALARAQCLLRSKVSLGKMMLLYQIEESLEGLAPACTLELLGMPHSPENAERRRGAISALRELLRQGLDVETTCQVQDWPCFMSQALNRLMAVEIVDLLPWDNIAISRKNKKSLESQNQRVVIDFNCFYMALIAHVALGFSSKQTELIRKAKTICECLMTSEGIDLKFEEAFCLFLLGEGTEAEALEKLKQLVSNSNPATRNSISVKEITDTSCASMEIWLKDSVLAVFPDTRDCSPSLANFFVGEKKAPGSKKGKGSPLTSSTVSHRSLSSTASEQRDFEDSLAIVNSSRNRGSVVKQLTPTNMQNPLISSKNSNGSSNVGNGSAQSVQLKRNLGLNQKFFWESWLFQGNVVKRITFVAVLGCAVFLAINFSSMKLCRTSTWASNKPNVSTSSLACKNNSCLNSKTGSACMKGSCIAGRIKNLFAVVRMRLRHHTDDGYLQSSCLPTSFSTTTVRRPMPIEEAEDLVKRWQVIKAEALGPSHQVHSLLEALDESMLVQWQSLADAAKARPCYWRFVLLQLTILQADILSDSIDGEMAEIKALIEEAAELVDESQPKNPNYYSTYKIHYVLKRQDDGSWKFCEGDVQRPV